MSDTRVTLKIDGGLATATLSTDTGLNVLSSPVLDEIAKMAARVRESSVRALVIAATGKVFVAGANIKELAVLGPAEAAEIAHRGMRTFDAIADLPCVTIARLHGAALGGGLELALACDFRLAVSSAKIGLPETSLGLIPGWKGISRLRALAGLSAAKRLIFSAAVIDAAEAVRYGIVDEVLADEAALDVRIAALLADLRRGGPHAIAMVKEALRTGDEVKAFASCFDQPEAKEGMNAFIEKRKAQWVQG